MEILDHKDDQELLESVIAEAAKAANELRCAKADIEKAQGRLSFVLVLANTLIDRQQGD